MKRKSIGTMLRRASICKTALSILREPQDEGFNGKLMDEKPTDTLFSTLQQARFELAAWRTDYNNNRPHSGLGWQTPIDFTKTIKAKANDVAIIDVYAPIAFASRAQTGTTNRPSELKVG